MTSQSKKTIKKYNNANGQNVSTDGIDIEDFEIQVQFTDKETKEKTKRKVRNFLENSNYYKIIIKLFIIYILYYFYFLLLLFD